MISDDAKDITFYNASHIEVQELVEKFEIDPTEIILNLKGCYVVVRSDARMEIMTESRLTEYAWGLMEANQDQWPKTDGRYYGLMTIPRATEVIEKTLNERVLPIKSKV